MLWLVPGHCDPTVNPHDFAIGVRVGWRKAWWSGSSGGCARRPELSHPLDGLLDGSWKPSEAVLARRTAAGSTNSTSSTTGPDNDARGVW